MKPSTMNVTVDGTEYEVEFTWTKPRPARVGCSNEYARPAEGGLEEISRVLELNHDGRGGKNEIEPDAELVDAITKAVEERLSEERCQEE